MIFVNLALNFIILHINVLAPLVEERILKKFRSSTNLKPDGEGPKSEIRDEPGYLHSNIREFKKELPRDLMKKFTSKKSSLMFNRLFCIDHSCNNSLKRLKI